MVGSFFHLFYMTVLVIYNVLIYIDGNGKPIDHDNAASAEHDDENIYAILLLCGTIYPALYDFSQMIRIGLTEYCSDAWNYTDMLYIWASIA